MPEQVELAIAGELAVKPPRWNNPMPLKMPDGVILAYACPQCLHVGGTIVHQDWKRRRQDSKEDATKCCCCHECGAHLGRRAFAMCAECEGRFQQANAGWEESYRRQLEIESEEYEAALALSLDREMALSLQSLMSDISEDHYCAGWLTGLEFDLWRILQGGSRSFGMGELTDDDVNRLRVLSERAGGWWVYDKHNYFVTMENWQKILSDRQATP